MDWKDKGIEAAYLGGLAIVGTWLTKKFKPLSKWFTNLSKLSARVDDIEKDYKAQLETLKDRLAKDENMLRSKFDSSEIPTYIMDADFELIYVNTAWLELLGFTNDEEVYGMGFLKAVPESYLSQMERQMKLSKDHPSRFSDKIPFKNVRTGEEFFMFCKSTPIYDYKDTLYCTLGFLYKID